MGRAATSGGKTIAYVGFNAASGEAYFAAVAMAAQARGRARYVPTNCEMGQAPQPMAARSHAIALGPSGPSARSPGSARPADSTSVIASPGASSSGLTASPRVHVRAGGPDRRGEPAPDPHPANKHLEEDARIDQVTHGPGGVVASGSLLTKLAGARHGADSKSHGGTAEAAAISRASAPSPCSCPARPSRRAREQRWVPRPAGSCLPETAAGRK